MIGKLPGHEIELMKLNEYLKPSRHICQEVWVWSESRAPIAPAKTDGSAVPPLLHAVLSKCQSPPLRQAFSRAARSYRQDIARVSGDLNQHGKQHDVAVADACIRLSRVHDALSEEDQAFLQALVLTGSSKSRLSRAFDLRPAAAETKALSVLRVLTNIYAR